MHTGHFTGFGSGLGGECDFWLLTVLEHESAVPAIGS